MQDTPKNLDQKRADEKMLVSEMIALYCHRQHKTPKGSLCPECRQLHDYALTRIDKCPFMETKTFCSACKVHCYKPEMREKIRAVMRWAGPRMLRCTRCFPSGMRQSHSGLSTKRKRLAEFSRINTLPAGHTVDREVINMENIGVTCDVCECSHNVSGCKCDLPQIKVTEQCTCDTQQVETLHYCQSYEKK